jgi:hypothetical protein
VAFRSGCSGCWATSCIEPNLGCVEGQDPIRLVEGEKIVNGRFEEFMPEEIKPVLEEHRKNSGGDTIFNDRKAYTQKQA